MIAYVNRFRADTFDNEKYIASMTIVSFGEETSIRHKDRVILYGNRYDNSIDFLEKTTKEEFGNELNRAISIIQKKREELKCF